MHEPSTDVTMDTLIARAAESIEPLGVRRLQEGLLAAAMSLAEVQAYEEALAMNDPVEANAMILAREEEPTFEMLRASVLSTLYSRMKRREEIALKAAAEVRSLHGEVAEEVAEYIELDRMREASFRRDPGRYLPGATNSSVRLFDPAGCWLIDRAGEPYPWICSHAALRYAQSNLDDVYDRAVRNGRYHVLLIGAPGLKERIVLPCMAAMAEIDIEILEIDVDDLTGPRGPNGSGRAA